MTAEHFVNIQTQTPHVPKIEARFQRLRKPCDCRPCETKATISDCVYDSEERTVPVIIQCLCTKETEGYVRRTACTRGHNPPQIAPLLFVHTHFEVWGTRAFPPAPLRLCEGFLREEVRACSLRYSGVWADSCSCWLFQTNVCLYLLIIVAEADYSRPTTS